MGARRDTFVDASRKHSCPVCGHTDFCTQARDGRTVICRREPVWNGRPGKCRPDSFGDKWTWYTGDARPVAPVAGPVEPPRQAAAVEDRARVYEALLDLLELAEDHRDRLTRPYLEGGRGMPPIEVQRRGYRTLRRGRARVAEALAKRFGGDLLAAVPGFFQHHKAAGAYWSIAGGSGMLVPVRNVFGRVTGMQIRLDETTGPKYVWLSSSGHGSGPGAKIACHVPLPSSPDGAAVVRLTEGPLKGDVATVLDPDHVLTLAIPGVVTWPLVLPVLEALRVRCVRLAFDHDWRSNRFVLHALTACAARIKELGYQREMDDWPVHPKGIDDLFASGMRPTVLRD